MLRLTAISLAAEAIGLTLAVWVGMRRRKLTWSQLGMRPISGSWFIASVALTFAAALAGGMVAALITQLLGEAAAGSNVQAQAIAPAGFSWAAAITMVFLGGIAVPIAEELFFRGVLHRWSSAKWGLAVGSIVSSLVFGLIHGIPAVIGFAFVMGLFIAYAYEKTQSLWPGIIIHIVNNSLKIALLYGILANGMPI